jgi:hypothetical protein
MDLPLRLYGMPGSLYTAKARAYLRKQHLLFAEVPVGDPTFGSVAAQIGRFIMPVVATACGTIIQDGTDIIDAVEAAGLARRSAYPDTPVQRVVALIFELFGGEGLLRPAMHYRWNFDADNLAFLRQDFVRALSPLADAAQGDAVFAMASGRMRKAAASFGVTPETYAAVEASYAEFLTLFAAHLETAPYLLGGRPTIGDYGLVGPLYAHLGRDPAPARLMQTTAWPVWRWTERMNAPEAALDGFAEAGETLFADDLIPETLRALMRFVAEDYLPELRAHIDFTNHWLADHADLTPGTNGLDNPAQRSIGLATFEWRGHSISTGVLPYRFWLLQRVQHAANALASDDRARLDALLDDTGLAEMLTLRTLRPVDRVNHLEVWGAAR